MLGADVINIVKEKQPGFWSNCYKVEAEFLRFVDREMVKNNTSAPKYKTEHIIKRSEETAKKNQRHFNAIMALQLLSDLLAK